MILDGITILGAVVLGTLYEVHTGAGVELVRFARLAVEIISMVLSARNT